MPIVRRSMGTCLRGILVRLKPFTVIIPVLAFSSRIISFIKVLLPAPDEPTTKTNSPLFIVILTSSRACVPVG